MARRTRAVAFPREMAQIARQNQAVAEQITAHAPIRDFLHRLGQMPSVSEVRVTAGDEGPTVWAIQEQEDLAEAHEVYLGLFDLLARDDMPYIDLYVVPRSESIETTLATAHKL